MICLITALFVSVCVCCSLFLACVCVWQPHCCAVTLNRVHTGRADGRRKSKNQRFSFFSLMFNIHHGNREMRPTPQKKSYINNSFWMSLSSSSSSQILLIFSLSPLLPHLFYFSSSFSLQLSCFITFFSFFVFSPVFYLQRLPTCCAMGIAHVKSRIQHLQVVRKDESHSSSVAGSSSLWREEEEEEEEERSSQMTH